METKAGSDSVFANVSSLIARKTGVSKNRIQDTSRMEQDLGIAGDDLVEVVDAIFTQFAVDPGDFRYVDYCSAEGFSPLGGLLGSESASVRPLTVGMLAQAVRDGRFDSSKAPQ